MNRKKLANKITVFFLIGMLGASAMQINQFVGMAFAQADNWYVGKGVKPDTYYTYEIKNADTNQGQPFTMTIYFKDYNETGKYWVAPTFVVDQGKVIGSNIDDDWNAIDPNVVFDEHNQPWLAFGSFWGGIKLRKLEQATGKLSSQDQNLYSLASRPRTSSSPGAIEAPNIIRKNGYYYLFVSFDLCCRGANSTYNIRVGRARRLTGPYIDRSGKAMIDGGGTLVVGGAGRWAGPGHCAVLQEREGDHLVYHAYDTEWRGVPTLRISSLHWDSEGWPAVSQDF